MLRYRRLFAGRVLRCETAGVLLVRGTKKVLERLGGTTASDADRSTTRLGDWYVNVLFFKPQLALFVSEATLLPVLIPFAPAATLLDRFPSTLMAHLQAHGVQRRFAELELAEMTPCRLAKTASRSVLGVMNELRFLANTYVKLDDETDPMSLAVRLAMTPCGPLYKRHGSPDRELAALASSIPDTCGRTGGRCRGFRQLTACSDVNVNETEPEGFRSFVAAAPGVGRDVRHGRWSGAAVDALSWAWEHWVKRARWLRGAAPGAMARASR